MKKSLLIGIAIVGLTACTHHVYTPSQESSKNKLTVSNNKVIGTETEEIITAQWPTTGGGSSARIMPNATAFRMSGDYANNVAVTISPDGVLTYFPAPSDITADSEPIEVGEGWWLNNQGLGPNSVFTTYTFAEYASLPSVPTPEQIKGAIIPGAKVTEFIELPMKASQAAGHLDEVRSYLKNR